MTPSLAQPSMDWNAIDTVFLDMDGTLLDLNFDNHFWQTHVPLRYAEAKGLPQDIAREELMARYHARAGTLDWYSVDFWATELELDIMALKEEVAHLIAVHPAVVDFLAFHGRHAVLAATLARRVTAHATPVGSGTVARTQRIPVEERAEAAVIAWLRHQTTAYDHMHIPREKGARREARRRLAEQSRKLLEKYRRGDDVDAAACPLQVALARR